MLMGKVGAVMTIMVPPVSIVRATLLAGTRRQIAPCSAKARSTLTGDVANTVRTDTTVEAWVRLAVVSADIAFIVGRQASWTSTDWMPNVVRADTAIETWVVPAVVVLHAAGWVITTGETGLRRKNT